MSLYQFEIIGIMALCAAACAVVGVFLVLRRAALMTDAISHSILLGIVLAFFVVRNLTSPWLIVGAGCVGVLTVWLTELISSTGKVKEDSSIGLVFPFLFSLGVILLGLFASNLHLDVDAVILGEVAFSPFNRLVFGGQDWGPVAMYSLGAILVLNIIFIVSFFKELKVSTFDPGLAVVLGISPAVFHYALMTMVSMTAVTAFEAVGSVLLIALIVVPAATAYLLTERLSTMLVLSVLIGVLSAVTGYGLAYALDASIAGSAAVMTGVFFVSAFLFAPQRGLIYRMLKEKFNQQDFGAETLSVHLLQAELSHAEKSESVVEHMKDHMLWEDRFTSDVIARCIEQGLVEKEGNRLRLTAYGREKAKNSLAKD